MLLEFVTTVEEVYCFEFGFHACLLFVGHILEGCAVLAEVESYELHYAFAADDVAAEVADYIDYLL